MSAKKFLPDVVIIRFCLIVMLVLCHAFGPYAGWEQTSYFPDNGFYAFISLFSSSFMLTSFVLISGIIFGYQVKLKGLKINLYFIKKKFKRLIIPSIIFSIIYYVLFADIHAPFYKIIFDVLSGCGHMWFLPMLFWCFIMMAIILALIPFNRLKYLFCIICLLPIFSFIPLPFGLGRALFYFLFFYVGFLLGGMQVDENDEINKIFNVKKTIIFSVIWLFSFCLYFFILKNKFDTELDTACNIIAKAQWLGLQNLIVLIYMFFGTLAFYGIVRLMIQKGRIRHINNRWVEISGYCFGIYIYQQFILKLFYYKSDLVQYIPVGLIPWAGFIIAIILSFILTKLTLKTRVGRLLIG